MVDLGGMESLELPAAYLQATLLIGCDADRFFVVLLERARLLDRSGDSLSD